MFGHCAKTDTEAVAKALLLALLAGLVAVPAAAAGKGACWVQDAAAAGNAVWLLCDHEQVLISEDQGQSWTTRYLPSTAKLRAIALVDSRHGFVCGENGLLLVTEDGGLGWRHVPVPTEEHLTRIHFVGRLGWIAGYGGTILHSNDGGMTWVRQFTGVWQPLEGIFFADAEHGWAVGWLGTILRTTDGGLTWQQAPAPTARYSLSSVYFRDAQNGWIVGMFGQILRSRDGGATWQAQPSPVQSWLQSVVFDQSGRGWIAGGTDLLVSEDGGETWKPVPGDGWLFLTRFVRVNDSLWAVGPFGVLRKDADASEAWRRLETVSLG